jgi:FkbM family methyltransferase
VADLHSLPFPEVTLEELHSAPEARVAMRGWEGIVDVKSPPRPTAAVPPAPHEADYQLFRSWPGADGLLVDVGANVGQTLLSFRAVGARPQALCFEPNPLAFRELAVNAAAHGPAVALRCGLGREDGGGTLLIPAVDGLLVTPLASMDPQYLASGVMRAWIDELAEGGQVRLLRLPIKILRGDDLGLQPDVLKIDVEGDELACVQGLSATLTTSRPVVMMEQNVPAAAELERLGFRLYAYSAPDHSLHLIDDLHDRTPAQLPLNFIALHVDVTRERADALSVRLT